MPAEQLTQVAALVPAEVAEDIRSLAQRSERSVAAEIRLALRAWIEAQEPSAA